MFCTNCGEQMRDADKFCAECGTPAAPRPRKSRGGAVAEEPSPSLAPTTRTQAQPDLIFSPSAQQTPPPARPVPQPPAANDEQRRVLLQAEEIASVRGIVPVEELPDEFATPAPSPAPPSAPAYNPWLDTGPAATPAPPARPKATSPPPPAPAPAPSAEGTAAKDSDFFYFYDDTSSSRHSRKLLITLLVVFVLGIAGIIYLMSRSPAKSAPPGNVTVAISPESADIITGQTQNFAATITGTGDTDVIWSVAEGTAGGTINNRGAQAQGGKVAVIGVYVAPTMPGTYHIIATSKADSSKFATAEVLVNSK